MIVLYKPLKYRNIWLGLGYVWVALTVYVCLIPNPPDTSTVQFGDKLIHMVGYFCLSVWFAQIFSTRYLIRPVIGLILLGVFIEILQGFSGYRSFEYADMIANSSGAFIGWLVSITMIGSLFVMIEKFVFRIQYG